MNSRGSILKNLLIILFFIYTTLFVATSLGYTKNIEQKKVLSTEIQIKDFEEKLKNNEPIDLDSYLKPEKDYSNIFTKSANTVLKIIKNIIEVKLVKLWHILYSIFTGK